MVNNCFHCSNCFGCLAEMIFINKPVILLWSTIINHFTLSLFKFLYISSVNIAVYFSFYHTYITFYRRNFYTAETFLAVFWLITFHIISSPTAFHTFCSIQQYIINCYWRSDKHVCILLLILTISPYEFLHLFVPVWIFFFFCSSIFLVDLVTLYFNKFILTQELLI